MSVSFSINACQLSGWASIIALVRAWWRLGPPSIRYDARVNGAPANPISGTSPRAATSNVTASDTG